MASSTLQLSSFALRSILEMDKLNETNFTNWYHNLRIVLNLKTNNSPSGEARWKWNINCHNCLPKYVEQVYWDQLPHACAQPDLQHQFENIMSRRTIWSWVSKACSRPRKVQSVSQALIGCKLTKCYPLRPQVIKMVGYIQLMDRLGFPLEEDFSTDVS